MNVVQVENVVKEYQLGEQRVTALKRVSLSIEQGVFMAIAGPSGSGKTTLLNLIGCIDTPTEGRILIDGNDVAGRKADELAHLRNRTIGFIFQTFNLLPVLTAAENVEYPLLRREDVSAEERARRVRQYLELVGLGAHM
ncbi:MAG: transporter family protein, partial [Rhodocyclales bacterium]|nr:transporter family protein [Rhodocyclales bacterium]